MPRIPIAGYVIWADGNGWTLGRESTNAKGELVDKADKYFSTIEQVLKGIIEQRARTSSATTLEALLEEMQEVKDELVREIRKVLNVTVA